MCAPDCLPCGCVKLCLASSTRCVPQIKMQALCDQHISNFTSEVCAFHLPLSKQLHFRCAGSRSSAPPQPAPHFRRSWPRAGRSTCQRLSWLTTQGAQLHGSAGQPLFTRPGILSSSRSDTAVAAIVFRHLSTGMRLLSRAAALLHEDVSRATAAEAGRPHSPLQAGQPP